MPLSKLNNLAVGYARTASLRTYENNARLHSRPQIRKLRMSLRKFGWTNPLIVDETGMILCGAGRFMAAQEEGLTEVPVIRLTDMSEADKRAYILADNKLAELASWSKSLLRKEMKGLVDIGYDVEVTGFDTIEVDTLITIDDDEAAADDDVHLPDEKTPPVCRLGDVWHIGDHRFAVGDARDRLIYERLLGSERAQLIFTDPPYGCRIAGNVSGLGQVRHQDFVMGAGEVSLPEFAHTLLRPAFRQMAMNAASGAIAFVCIDWRAAPHLLDAAQGVFHETKNLIIWSKTNAGMGTFYRSAHELIYAFKVSPGTHINNFGLGEGGRHRSNVWIYPGANTFRKGRMEDLAAHSTVKPKSLVADAILDCSKPGGIVLDPFVGSGTTLVAAEMTGRRGYGIELDPKYADVVLQRVTEATGLPALLDGRELYADVVVARATSREG